MPELRAEETRLRAGGMSGASQSFVLAAQALLPALPPPLWTTDGKSCHTEDICQKKQRDKNNHRGESSAACSITTSEQEVLTLFPHLNVVASSPSGTGAQASGTPPPPPPSDRSSKWFLDSGASFHMAPDSRHLSSMSHVDPPPIVQTADGATLLLVGRGVLSTSSFHVTTVSHVPQLTMQLLSTTTPTFAQWHHHDVLGPVLVTLIGECQQA